MKYVFMIKNMNCQHCVGRIKNVLEKTKGITKFNIDLTKKTINFDSNEDFSLDELKKLLDEAHYPISE